MIRLERERLKRDWRLADVAERLGVTESTVCDWEKKRSKPTYDKLLKLCKLFNIEHGEVKGLFEPAPGKQE